MMKFTAIANANIALVKYWGNRNIDLTLPLNSSISVTLDGLNAVTTVEFDEKYKNDILILNGTEVTDQKLERVSKTLDNVRNLANITTRAKVSSNNNFPTAAGLASSAAGGAAIALAASKAAGLNFSERELSVIARKFSGSASRSVIGGFVEWNKGEEDDGSDCFAKQLAPIEHWSEFRIIATIISKEEKKVSSRTGMSRSVRTSPFYNSWLDNIQQDLDKIKKGVLEKDLALVGQTAEQNAVKMHSLAWTAKPSINYWAPGSLVVIKLVNQLRDEGIECYYTMDAGPQVKIICLEKDVEDITKVLKQSSTIKEFYTCKPGGPVKLSEKHLF